MKVDSRLLRDCGYEVLFLLGGLLALSLRPTMRHAMELESQIGDVLLRRREFRQLSAHGWVESGGDGMGGIVKLTKLGGTVLHGGRVPEEAWGRGWDGQWRLLLFDLPRDARAVRARFWRWLRANHFGQFQASAWITPDPVPDIGRTAAEEGLEDSLFTVFTGQIAGKPRSGAQVAAAVWDFGAINSAYRAYQEFAKERLGEIARRAPSAERLSQILHEDHKQWWRAVQPDPLLPAEVLPRGYQGKVAWKHRQKLLVKLLGAINPEDLC